MMSGRIVPTPALAAADSTLSKRRVRGRIRIQRKDESASYYVSKILQAKGSEPGRVRVTASLSEALEVEYDSLPPSDDPRTLFIPDVSGFPPPIGLMELTSPISESTSGL